MTAPAMQQDSLTQLLDLSDVSRARTTAIEDQTSADIDRIYAQHLFLYLQKTSPAQQSEDEEHPLVTLALLTAMVAVLQSAFRKGAEEGRRFASQQVEVVGGRLADGDRILDSTTADDLSRDFVRGQRALAGEGGKSPEELSRLLAGRAKLAAITSIQSGKNQEVENELKNAVGSWTGEVQKLWVARFDLETAPCPLCIRLHGLHVPLDKSFPEHHAEPAPYFGTISRPPRHPNCRCSTVLYLPSKMKDAKDVPTSLSMIQYADRVLSLIGSNARNEFVAATMVWVRPYSRFVDGNLNFVKGYYFDIATGTKYDHLPHHNNRNAPGGGGRGGSVPSVSVGAIHTMSLPNLNSKSLSGGRSAVPNASSAHAWSAGSYRINLPDGSHAELEIGADGSGTASHLGKVEKVDSSGVSKYLGYWNGLGKVDSLKSDPETPVIGKRHGDPISQPQSELLIGKKTFARNHVADAIKILNNENSTSIKAPLKKGSNPLGSENLKQIAEDHAGKSIHYSKLRQGVVDALQHHLDQHDNGSSESATTHDDISSMSDEDLSSALGSAHENFAKIRTQGSATNSPEYIKARDEVRSVEAETARREQAIRGDAAEIPDAPTPPRSAALPVSAVSPATLSRQELTAWSGVLASAKSAFKINPEPGDRGSALAAGLQKVASTRHRYYVGVSDKDSKVSMKMLPLEFGSSDHNYMIHSNGSIWERTLDGDGVERLTPVSVGRVRQMTDSHFSSVDGVSLDKALSNVRALTDAQLDSFLQKALVNGNMEAFDRLSAEADRRDAVEKRKRADDEKRALQLEKLLEAGGHEESAIEQVYGVTADSQRRKSAIASLRAEGYTGVNLSELARKAYKDYIYQLYLQAEFAMHGHMLTKEGESKNLSPLALFSGPESRVAKYASPELVEWFELHGRLTFKDWMDNYLGKFSSARV